MRVVETCGTLQAGVVDRSETQSAAGAHRPVSGRHRHWRRRHGDRGRGGIDIRHIGGVTGPAVERVPGRGRRRNQVDR